MKYHILFRCLGFPLLTASIIWPSFDRLNFRLLLFSAIVAGILLRYILNRKMYLTDLAIENDGLHIQYMTAFLNKRSLHLNVHDLEGLKLVRDRIRYEYAGFLLFRIHGKSYNFPIIKNSLFESAEKLMGSAKLAVAHGG